MKSEAKVPPREAHRSAATPIHVPDERAAARSRLAAFIRFCEQREGTRFHDYFAFEAFAIAAFRPFWRHLLGWADLVTSGSADRVCDRDDVETATFFPDLKLNYAENLLKGPGDAYVLTACHGAGPAERLTRAELRGRVERFASALRALGVEPGDRVAAVARNGPEAVVAALASAALGAAFSSCSPDMGPPAILSRLGQLRPKVLIAHLHPEPWDTGMPVAERIAEVASGIESLACLVALDSGASPAGIDIPVHRYADMLEGVQARGFQAEGFVWERFAFNHPLFIMFSSGTTGAPKCIVHGAGGTLIEHVKEHRLHGDLGPGDKLYFHTSCAWMMWNWQLSALASGVEIVLYDGVVRRSDTLWRIVSEQSVTVFGTSPSYLQLCRSNALAPGARFDLASLRAVLSTGSILQPDLYQWVRDEVKSLPLQSISGGTDIIGCFMLGNPLLPVFEGEAQCRSLGLDVRAHLSADAPYGGIGELVCVNPFPSRPLGFHGDVDGRRFHEAYFSQIPPHWRHGDLVEPTRHGGMRLHGRSDGVLNIRGIRIGPAEIAAILRQLDDVAEVMAVEQEVSGEPPDVRLVLLVVLRSGQVLDDGLSRRIRLTLAEDGSPAFVPARIFQVDELPTTFNGKRSEFAAREALNGREPRNLAALVNPGSVQALLDIFRTEVRERSGADEEPLRRAAAGGTQEELQAALGHLFGASMRQPVGPDDDYLEMGIDSLQLLSLAMRIEELVDLDIPLPTIFEARTTRELTRIISEGDFREQQSADSPRVRPARETDIEEICRLLEEGFGRDRAKRMPWRRIFEHGWGGGRRDFGFVLTVDETIIGFIGAVFSHREGGGGPGGTVCNLTSWYVRAAFQGWGSLLLQAAISHADVTYTSLSPGQETVAILDALKFRRMPRRRFFLPFGNARTLMGKGPTLHFDRAFIRRRLTAPHRRIFDDHAGYDLLHVLIRDGASSAYLIAKRRKTTVRVGPVPVRLPYSEILFCSDPDLLATHLERAKLAILLRQGSVALAADESVIPPPIRAAAHSRSVRYYASGRTHPGKLDLLYSELVLLEI